MHVLALDFDGVISDSAPEAFVVALRTFAALTPGTALATEAACFAGHGAPPLEQVRSSGLFADFLELMPLGNRAEDYGVVLSALARGFAVPDQAAYDALRDAHDASSLRSFHTRFYSVRDHLSEADPDGWRRLMAPYPAFLSVLRRRAADAELTIATAKDRRSVEALLRLYGLESLFAGDRILDKETGEAKTAHMRQLRRQFGVEFREITFVDDKLNHLDSVAALGVRCALAAWGYNGDREIRLARERGYCVCRLDDVEQKLFGAYV
jgi:phosphoglycolate phosphatase-like HAD superfamily hydrolase